MVAHRRETLIDRAGEAGSVREVFAAASERMRGLVPFDAAVWLASDPATSLPTAPTRSENMGFVGGSDGCLRLWELEFFAEDVNLYCDVARAPTPARALREATSDRPARSARYREFLRPNGLDDELRAVLRVDGDAWAWLSLFREQGRPAFDPDEVDLVASLSGPLGEAVRDQARSALPLGVETADRGPGLMLFAPTGELISINDDARAWLDEFPPDSGKAGPSDVVNAAGNFDVRLPMAVAAALMRAWAIAEERDHGSARARLRSRASGRWLVCHASCLRDPEGGLANTALAIEPAKPSEVAPIIVQAYELTPREQEITELIAQGLDTGDIAHRLHLSPHTVRDYVKAIFDKVHVSSRGELVAKLFADHYAPIHTDPSALEQVDA
jgi:DNA-binding CsgD family transcriptional regulator